MDPVFIMVDTSCIVNCKEPSPTNKMTLFLGSTSLAATLAPSVAPTEYPIEPHKICDIPTTLFGNRASRIP